MKTLILNLITLCGYAIGASAQETSSDYLSKIEVRYTRIVTNKNIVSKRRDTFCIPVYGCLGFYGYQCYPNTYYYVNRFLRICSLLLENRVAAALGGMPAEYEGYPEGAKVEKENVSNPKTVMPFVYPPSIKVNPDVRYQIRYD